MNKSIIIFLLILTFFSCRKRNEFEISRFDIEGKTFDVYVSKENDTSIIDFKDSIYSFIGERHTNSWNLSFYEGIPFLDLGRSVVGIKKMNDTIFKLIPIEYPEDEIIMTKRKTKWQKDQLYGIWIEEKYFGTKSTQFPPPIPPIDREENDFTWPPFYKITKDTIHSNFYYKDSNSNMELNNTNEYVKLNLKSKFDIEETYWEIMNLTDSTMTINRIIKTPHDFNYRIETENNIRLIKKR